MIHFVGNVQSQYGRGKDKTKRKSRVSPLIGAGLGTVAGGPVGTIAGALIAKGVNKERDRFDKSGARTHLGKVGHDARLGAKSMGIGSAITAGLAGAALGSKLPTQRKKGFLGLGRDKKAEARDKLKNTLMGAGLGIIGGGVTGAINGAGTGALVGAGRGFVQENRMGKKKKGKFNQYIDVAEFAFGLPQIDRRKTLKRNAKLGGRVGALAGAAHSLRGSKSIKGAVLQGALGAVGGSLLASGATGVNNLLKRKTIKVGKKTYTYSSSGDIVDFAFGIPQPQKTRRQIVASSTKKGAKVGGLLGAGYVGGSGVLGSLKNPGSIKSKLAGAALYGTTGALAGGLVGGVGGGAAGSQVGVAKALLAPRKKKTFLDKFKK